MAAVDDDTIYVAVRRYVAHERASPREARGLPPCDRRPLVKGPTTLLRLDGGGRVLWRKEFFHRSTETAALLASRTQLILAAFEENGKKGTPTMLSLDTAGKEQWEKPIHTYRMWWGPQGQVLFDNDVDGANDTCTWGALEGATGELVWERTVGSRAGSGPNCRIQEVSVSRDAVIVSTGSSEDELSAIDARTGAVHWKKPWSSVSAWPLATSAAALERWPLFVRRESNAEFYERKEYRAIGYTFVVAIDPKTARGVRLAKLEEHVAGYSADGPYARVATWGRDSLWITGGFHGKLKIGKIESPTGKVRYSRECRTIDPGFYIDGPPHFEPIVHRFGLGWSCPPLSLKQRVRTVRTDLFLARLPLPGE
jgi:outer membrane protein assembly factor BamB